MKTLEYRSAFVELAELSQRGKERLAQADRIIDAASARYDIRRDLLLADFRGERPITTARHIAIYACYVMTGLSNRQLGLVFGREATSISHAYLKVKGEMELYPKFRADVEQFIASLS